MRNKLLGILVGGALAATASNGAATPFIAIDLDLFTPGIQSTRIVSGAVGFSAAVVAFDDGTGAAANVDSVFLDVTSDNVTTGQFSAPHAAAFAPPTISSPTAGNFVNSLVAAGPVVGPIDAATGVPVAAGTSLSNFAGANFVSLGTVGYFATIFQFGLPALTVDAGATIATATNFDTIIDIVVVASVMPGVANLTISPFPLAFGGAPLAGLVIGNAQVINQQSMVMPEPTSMILFGAGLLGLAGLRRRRKVS